MSPASSPRHSLHVVTASDHFKISPPREELRILQVTDMHMDHNYFHKQGTFASVRGMCEKFNVDLVVNTGDFFCHNSLFVMKRVCRSFDRIIGDWCPWTFAWGNHDCDNFEKGDLEKADRIEAMFAALPHCLYKPTRQYIEAHAGPGPRVLPYGRSRSSSHCHASSERTHRRARPKHQ